MATMKELGYESDEDEDSAGHDDGAKPTGSAATADVEQGGAQQPQPPKQQQQQQKQQKLQKQQPPKQPQHSKPGSSSGRSERFVFAFVGLIMLVGIAAVVAVFILRSNGTLQ